MSFSFYVPAPTPPDSRTILDGLDAWDVRCEEGDVAEGPWPDGTLHFFREGVSTRGVEITCENARFQVRILTLSSPEDYELAIRFVECAAVLLKQYVEPEDGLPFGVDDLRQRYDDNWVRHTNESGAKVLRSIIGADDSTATLSGPNRPFYIGPRVLAEIDAAGPEEEFVDRLVEKMREVQNVDDDFYYLANTMEAKRKEEDDEGFTFAVWGPGVYYLMPNVEYYALIIGDEEPPVFMPSENLPDVLADGWTYLDEKQVYIDAVDEEVWPQVVARAREFAANPFEGD